MQYAIFWGPERSRAFVEFAKLKLAVREATRPDPKNGKARFHARAFYGPTHASVTIALKEHLARGSCGGSCCATYRFELDATTAVYRVARSPAFTEDNDDDGVRRVETWPCAQHKQMVRQILDSARTSPQRRLPKRTKRKPTKFDD